ncbi:RtcB family protein [Candidatus Parvarchaeota archaeon]|jgi:tRNA-splicing ligase RtcB|nr:RtcB family protein [Candidatus Parvarchaeota archaeon]
MEVKEIRNSLKEIDKNTWESKKAGNVPIRLYANENLLKKMEDDVFKQAANAASLPGILNFSYLFSDAHIGYGVPVGWAGAFDLKEGIISPGAIGFDINCGMRLIKTNLTLKEVKPKIKELIDTLFKMVPAGVGSNSPQMLTKLKTLNKSDLKEIAEEGVEWTVRKGYATEEDKERIEEQGRVKSADFSEVSEEAFKRGKQQLGTLGSGNHYLEVQVVNKDFDKGVANSLDLDVIKEQVVIMFHTGSRGFGHQIASDYIKKFLDYSSKNGITLKDRQLAYAPFNSEEGQAYFKAMSCGINFAFVNRQIINYQIREAFKNTFKRSEKDLGLDVIYDVSHNTAKIEEYTVKNKKTNVIIHRKGATRSFGPGNKELKGILKKIGQPVIVGGSMETGSYLCIGTKKAEEESFGTTLHGSGRTMSRVAARSAINPDKLLESMKTKDIYVKANSITGLTEEGGSAYKDINEVVDSMDKAGISLKILSLRPIGNIKG